MSNLIKIKKLIINHKNIFSFCIIILMLPFALIILNYLFDTIFNIGTYTGTFMRYLYKFIVN